MLGRSRRCFCAAARLQHCSCRRSAYPSRRYLLTDEHGAHIGGLWSKCAYDWLFVELLVVPEEYRGGYYGKSLMSQAEGIARANGYIGLWLNTYEFQARGFYENQGFEVFGTLDGHPIGQKRFFLRKRFQ